MEDFKYYSGKEKYQSSFYKFPKVLFESKKYKKLSLSSKVFYMLLVDRFKLSLSNGWLDDEGHVYLILTNEEASETLGISLKTITKIKKELISEELIKIKRLAPQKISSGEWVNRPDLIYLGSLILDHGVYSNVQEKNAFSIYPMCIKEKSENVKISLSKERAKEQTLFEKEKNTCNQEKNLDYKDNKDKYSQLDMELIQNHIKIYGLIEQYGERIVNVLIEYSENSFSHFINYFDILRYGIKSAEEKMGRECCLYSDINKYAEIYRGELLKVILNCIEKDRRNKIKNVNDYLFISIKNTMINILNQIK